MVKYDREAAERVWQRVQGQQGQQEEKQQPARGSDLPALILAEQQAAAAYAQLARQMPQKEAALLRRMSQEEQSHAAALQGMYTLITGERTSVKAPAVQPEPVHMSLRRAYAGELQSIAAYEARSSDAEYGHIFASMAGQEREHSRSVLELIGGMGKK